ncbi:MAG TPA: FtsX-like permease family protein, partial [Blastocatellia bacterium]
LLLARAAVRQRETGIRLALGAGRGRLVRQLLTESILLSVIGAAIGLAFAHWASRGVVGLLSFWGDPVSLDLKLDGRILGFTTAIAVSTGVLFGLVPAWRSSRIQPHLALKTGGDGHEHRSRFTFGKVLVMGQMALSMMLIVGAGLLLGTFRSLTALDPGFHSQGVLIVGVNLANANYPKEQILGVCDKILDRLRAAPVVVSASSSDMTPIGGLMWVDDVVVEGYAGTREVSLNRVSDDYFRTLGTPFLSGRDFNRHDSLGSARVAIINETMAREFFADSNPLGRTFRTWAGALSDSALEIVGVVKDAKYASVREACPPTAYIFSGQNDQRLPSLRFEVKGAGPASALIPSAKDAIASVNPDITMNFISFGKEIADSLSPERLLAVLSAFFGGLALLLATVGLYGVVSYNVTRRRREIGIRMALGAKQRRVLRMVLGEVGLIAVIGLLAGTGAAFGTTRLISSMLYGVKATDPITFSLSICVLGAAAIVAGYLPALRASRVDPMTALREE